MGNEKREKIITGNKVSKGCQKEEEEEEQKMEKFYALIRSFRDARDHRRNELKQMEIINKQQQQQQQQQMILKKRKLAAGEQQTVVSNSSSSSLVPSFRMEDFTQQEGAELMIKRTTPLLKFPAAPFCFNKNIHQPPNNDDPTPSPSKDDESAGLDLKLAL